MRLDSLVDIVDTDQVKELVERRRFLHFLVLQLYLQGGVRIRGRRTQPTLMKGYIIATSDESVVSAREL